MTAPGIFLLESDYIELGWMIRFYETELLTYLPGAAVSVEAERLTYGFAMYVEGWSNSVGDGWPRNQPVLESFREKEVAIRKNLCAQLIGHGGGIPRLWWEDHTEFQSWWNAQFYFWPDGVFHPNRKKEEEEGVTFP
jgi:hypothetical protein